MPKAFQGRRLVRLIARGVLILLTVTCFGIGLELGLAHRAGSGRGISLLNTRGEVLFSLRGAALTVAAVVFMLLTAVGFWLCGRLPARADERGPE